MFKEGCEELVVSRARLTTFNKGVVSSIVAVGMLLLSGCGDVVRGSGDNGVVNSGVVGGFGSYVEGKDCVSIDSGSVSGDAVRTDFGLLLRRGERIVLDDSGSERVLTGGVDEVFAVEAVDGGVGVVYGEVGDESNLIELVFNQGGVINKRELGAYKAPEFLVTGVSLRESEWIVTSISDLTEMVEIIPVGGGEGVVIEPYDYNSEPFLHIVYPRYAGNELLFIEEFEAKSDFNKLATGWSVARIEGSGLVLERVEWPSNLGIPSGDFDYVRSGESLLIYVKSVDGGGGVVIDDGKLSFKKVCTALKGRWIDRRS